MFKAGTDKNLFRRVPKLGHGAQICSRTPKKAMFRLVPMPLLGARTPSLNGAIVCYFNVESFYLTFWKY